MSCKEHGFCKHNLILCQCTICDYNSQCLTYNTNNTSQLYLDFTDIEFTEEDFINVDEEIEAIIQEKLGDLLDLSYEGNLQYSEDGTQLEFMLVESTNEQRRIYEHHDQNWKRNSNPTTPILDSPDSGKHRRIVDGDNTRETLHNGNNSTMEINEYNGTTPTNDENNNDTRIGQQPRHIHDIHYQHKFTNVERDNIAKTFKPIETIRMDTIHNIDSITEPTREHDIETHDDSREEFELVEVQVEEIYED